MPGAQLSRIVVLALLAHSAGAAAPTPAPSLSPPSTVQASECNQPARDPVAWVDLPGKLPFQALPSKDGCWIFVSLAVGDSEASDSEPAAQIAVFKRQAGQISLVRTVHVGGNPTGMVLTHDGRLLIVADGQRVAFLESARLTSGQDKPVVGYWNDGTRAPGRTYVNVTVDDAHLFVSDENSRTITVLNLVKARASGFTAEASIGKIPVGLGPVALTFSSDERYLYNTSLGMPPGAGWPPECGREWLKDSAAQPVPQGAIFVVDVDRAKSRPETSVVSIVPAGCTPVRLVISPKGDVAYVSARGSNALLAFDTARLVSEPAQALLGRVPTGAAPIGVAVIDAGRKVILSNSNRFGASATEPQSLLVIDAAKISTGKAAIQGSIPAGALPREMRLTSDERTLLVVNTVSRKLQVIDLARLPQAQRSNE